MKELLILLLIVGMIKVGAGIECQELVERLSECDIILGPVEDSGTTCNISIFNSAGREIINNTLMEEGACGSDFYNWTFANTTIEATYSIRMNCTNGEIYGASLTVINSTTNNPISDPSIFFYNEGINTVENENTTDYLLNGSFYGNMTIYVNVSLDLDNNGTVNHTLYLCNPNGSLNTTINTSLYSPDDSDLFVYFNTIEVDDNATYTMNVTVVADDDSGDIRSFLSPNNFSINQSLYHVTATILSYNMTYKGDERLVIRNIHGNRSELSFDEEYNISDNSIYYISLDGGETINNIDTALSEDFLPFLKNTVYDNILGLFLVVGSFIAIGGMLKYILI
jgi:hypothetical protein